MNQSGRRNKGVRIRERGDEFKEFDTPVTTVEGRAYPSTAVQGAWSKKYKERPKWTPGEMQELQELFKDPSFKRPTLRLEHSKDSREELGTVKKVWYNRDDKWLWMRAKFHPNKEHYAKEILRDKRFRGISLAYEVDSNYKKLLEFSVVSDPDFQNAHITSFHSAEREGEEGGRGVALFEQSLKYGPGPRRSYFHMAQQEDLEIGGLVHPIEDGSLIVANESLVDRAQAYAIRQGLDPTKVRVQSLPGYDSMTEEQRKAAFAASVAIVEGIGRKHEEEEHSKVQQEAEALLRQQKPFADKLASFVAGAKDDSEREQLSMQFAQKMITEPSVNAISLVTQACISQLEEQNAAKDRELLELRSQLSRQRETVQRLQDIPRIGAQAQLAQSMTAPTFRAHSGAASRPSAVQFLTSTDFCSDLWKRISNSAQKQGVPPMSPSFSSSSSSYSSSSFPSSSSSSSSSSSTTYAHSAGSSLPSFPSLASSPSSRSSAKRDRDDLYTFDGFSLYANVDESETEHGRKYSHSASQDPSSVQIYAHSSSSSSSAIPSISGLPVGASGLPLHDSSEVGKKVAPTLLSLTNKSTTEDVVRANVLAIERGERDIGQVTPGFMSNSVFGTNPQMFMRLLVSDMRQTDVQTNSSAQVYGHASGKRLPAESPFSELVQRPGWLSQFGKSRDQFQIHERSVIARY